MIAFSGCQNKAGQLKKMRFLASTDFVRPRLLNPDFRENIRCKKDSGPCVA